MVVVRATQKVLRKVPDEVLGRPWQSTTALGDWYADLLFTRSKRLVLLVNERSLLPVFVPARDWANFSARFRETVDEVLTRLGAPRDAVAAEVHEMSQVTFDRTVSRTILGSMNDFALLARSRLNTTPDVSLLDVAVELSQMPCGPLGYRHPRGLAVGLLARPEPAGSRQ